MAITSICAGCGQTLAVADEFAGRLARCPQCSQVYTVPMPSAPPVDSSAQNAGESAPSSNNQIDSTPPAAPLSGPGSLSGFPPSQPALPPGYGNVSAPNSPWPATPPSVPNTSGSDSNVGASATEQYWMRSGVGAEYGPADEATLRRWFAEGRVGADYLIRQGEFGLWRPAADWEAQLGLRTSGALPTSSPSPYISPVSTNPFAAPPSAGMPMGSMPQGAPSTRWAKSDQSGLVLAMGILAWVTCPFCFPGFICGIIAWVIGRQSIQDVQNGLANPKNLSMLQVGYYLGMINVIMSIVLFGLWLTMAVFSALAGNL